MTGLFLVGGVDLDLVPVRAGLTRVQSGEERTVGHVGSSLTVVGQLGAIGSRSVGQKMSSVANLARS